MFLPQEGTDNSNYDHDFKIVFVGEKGVGKTSLICRLVFNIFTSALPTTLGISVFEYKFRRNGLRIRVRIWDTPGHESSRDLATNFFRAADAIVIVFDYTNRQSFLNLDEWCPLILRSTDNSIFPFIVGTKCDAEDLLVNNDELSQFAERNLFLTFQTSAVTGVGVQRMMNTIVDTLLFSALRNRGFRLQDPSRVANRGRFGGWSLAEACCGVRPHSPSPTFPNLPTRIGGLITDESAGEVRGAAAVGDQAAVGGNPVARDLPSAEGSEVPEDRRDAVAHLISSLKACTNAIDATSDHPLEESRRSSASGAENPAQVVPSVASAVDPEPPTLSTSSAVANGEERDLAPLPEIETDSQSFTIESGMVASFPDSDSEVLRPDSYSDIGSTTSVSSRNDTAAFSSTIMTPD